MDFDPILLLLIITAASTFVVYTAFMALSTAKRMLALDALPIEMKLTAYALLVMGYPADILFNLIRGTIIFRELPREFLFSSRVQRHYKRIGIDNERYRTAAYWAKVLNAADPGHIRPGSSY